MKKIILPLLAVIALASCGDNPNKPLDDTTPKKTNLADSLLGDWITTGEEATGEISDTMGVTLKKGGEAQSINMPTYQYQEWSLHKDTIVMKAVSKAVGLPDEAVTDTGIVNLDKNTISLTNGDIVYERKM